MVSYGRQLQQTLKHQILPYVITFSGLILKLEKLLHTGDKILLFQIMWNRETSFFLIIFFFFYWDTDLKILRNNWFGHIQTAWEGAKCADLTNRRWSDHKLSHVVPTVLEISECKLEVNKNIQNILTTYLYFKLLFSCFLPLLKHIIILWYFLKLGK